MKEFLEYLVKSIVPHHEDVEVTEEVREDIQDPSKKVYDYKIRVNKEDMGIIIGKEGRVIRSLRLMAKSKAIKDGVLINVELVEDAQN